MNYNIEKPIPGVFVIDNFIDNSEEVISLALKRGEKEGTESALVVTNSGEAIEKKEVRNTTSINLTPEYSNDVFWWLLAQKIWQFGDIYGKHHGVGFSFMQEIQLLHYKKNQGFYKIHADSGPNIPRVFSAVLYLNDVEKGGETYFDKFDFSISPKAGRLIMFPANFVYSHGAKIPESNDKYCIVTWFTP